MIAAKASLADAKEAPSSCAGATAILRNAIERRKPTEASLQKALQDSAGVAVALNRTAIGYRSCPASRN